MKNFIPIPFTDVELKDNFWSERLVVNQKKTLAVRFGFYSIIIMYDFMIILAYICILALLIRPTFYFDLSLCLLFLSIPIAVKLMIDIHSKKKEDLNSVLMGTSNFMRIFFLLLILGILL